MSDGAHPDPGAKIMTSTIHTRKRSTIVSLAAAALTLGITFGLVYFAPSFANEPAGLASSARQGIESKSASQIVPCLMPAAWRRGCEK
jgi:hypothetical protein